ncbi:MAG TPA: hypothetical protein VM580_23520 [Labilithrix sp.]|nr:hypothetical protein [Labilithrix sp.]
MRRLTVSLGGALSVSMLALWACVGQDLPPGPSSSSGLPDASSSEDASADSGTTSACAAPFADCDGDGTCETSLEVDPANCGVCGHDCGAGAACAQKSCQPVTLMSNLSKAASAAVNATALVVLAEGGPKVCPKSGCAGSSPAALASGEVFPAAPHTISLDANNAYWLGRSGGAGGQYELRLCAIAGCGLAPATIDDAQLGSEMRREQEQVLRYDPSGDVTRIYVDGSKPKEYLTNASIPNSLYFALWYGKMAFSNTDSATGGTRGVYVSDFANAVPTRIMNEGQLVAMIDGVVYASRAVDGTFDAIFSCPITGCGGVGTNLGGTGSASATGKIADMIADASGLYWVESLGSAGRVMHCSLPDCKGGPRALASSQNNPVMVTTDESFVYWVNAGTGASDGAVVRVAK